jgi:small subunit ribosomal protein S6
MRNYELTLILRQEEDRYASGKQKAEAILQNHGVKVDKQEEKGLRDLAYEIQRQQKARYLFLECQVSPDQITPIEREFKLSGDIMKYLFVRKG